MRDLPLQLRARYYSEAYPKWPDSWPTVATGRWLNATWVIGNNYRGSGYYGSYPPGYVDRVLSMFPDRDGLLHLCSGSLPRGDDYLTLDINPENNPDIVCSATDTPFFCGELDFIMADIPYGPQHAERYGYPMPNRRLVVRECARILKKNGFLVWLDLVLPMYRKDEVQLCGLLTIVGSTNHRVRLASVFRRI